MDDGIEETDGHYEPKPLKVVDDVLKINELVELYGLKTVSFYRQLSEVPNVSGVYILWSGDGLEYIGQSVHILRRLANNHRVFKTDAIAAIGIIPVEGDLKNNVEVALIGLMKPKNNEKWRPKELN